MGGRAVGGQISRKVQQLRRRDGRWIAHTQDLIDALFLVERLRSNLSRSEVAPTSSVIQKFIDALSQDLDTPKALDILKGWCEATENGEVGGSAGELSRAIDSFLGIAL